METPTTALPHSGLWLSYIRRMMDPGHRLVLRWCAYLDFEEVLRIDHGSIHTAMSDPRRYLGDRRIVFGDGRLPARIVPGGLVKTTQQYAGERSLVTAVIAAHAVRMFTESCGEPITRTSLRASIRRAITLVRLSDAYLSGKVATR